MTAIYLTSSFGEKSDGVVRLSLGLILIAIACIFILKVTLQITLNHSKQISFPND